MNTKSLIALALLALAAIALTGCNTIEGAGEDVSAVGEGVSDIARDTGDAISGKK